MEPTPLASPASRLAGALPSAGRAASQRSKVNAHQFREQWLQAAITIISPMFSKAGSPIPDEIRAAIGFPSRGGKGNCVGECWHSMASADKHFEIFIRPDKSDPNEVLGILTHELVHAALPIGSGHGPIYKALALKIGLEGKMRHAMPGMHLSEVLKGIAAELGPLPHASLDLSYRESAPRKKQKTNLLKAWCPGVKDEAGKVTDACDYVCRITMVHAQKGAPLCGVHNLRMTVDWPSEDEDSGEDDPPEVITSFKAPPPTPQKPPVDPSSIASESTTTAPPGFRPVEPGEVFAPGRAFKMNISTGEQHVNKTPDDTKNEVPPAG